MTEQNPCGEVSIDLGNFSDAIDQKIREISDQCWSAPVQMHARGLTQADVDQWRKDLLKSTPSPPYFQPAWEGDEVWDVVDQRWKPVPADYEEPKVYAASDHSEEAIQSREREARLEQDDAYRRFLDGDTSKDAMYHAFSEEEMEQARAVAGWAERKDVVAEILGEPQQEYVPTLRPGRFNTTLGTRQWVPEQNFDPAADILDGGDGVPKPPPAPIDRSGWWWDPATTSDQVVAAPSFRANWRAVSLHVSTSAGTVRFTIGKDHLPDNLRHLVGQEAHRPRIKAPRPQLTPEMNARRHGRAAECPKHGPTTGGLCRKCR